MLEWKTPTQPAESETKAPTLPEEEVIPMPTPPTKEVIPVQTTSITTERADEEDTMPYPYSRYNDEPDAEAHVCTFLTTWQGNHVSQRLSEAKTKNQRLQNSDCCSMGNRRIGTHNMRRASFNHLNN